MEVWALAIYCVLIPLFAYQVVKKFNAFYDRVKLMGNGDD